MGEEMVLTHLQRNLRNLCYNTEWKYAAFWKLQHGTPMMLTLEDAYYNNQESLDSSDHMCVNVSLKNMHEGHYLQDPLGLAVAKMSYFVYSLGEGIIGQVAITGKHQWIFEDKPGPCSWSSSEFCDVWQTQFSSGIKTVAVVAIVPDGVVQLGSLNTVIEDMKVVTHIKEVFHSIQNSSVEFIPNRLQHTVQSTLDPSKISAKSSGLEIFDDFPESSNKAISNEKANIRSHLLQSLRIFNDLSCDVLPLPSLHQRKADGVVNKDLGVELTTSRDDGSAVLALLQQKSEILKVKQLNQEVKLLNKNNCGEENRGWMEMAAGSKHSDATTPYNFPLENVDNVILPAYTSGIGYPFCPLGVLESAGCDRVEFDSVVYVQKKDLRSSEPLEMQLGKCLEQNLETEVSCIDSVNTSLKFSFGCELHEALGSTFKKEKDICAWSKSEDTESEIHSKSPERMFDSQLTVECGLDHLVRSSKEMSSNTQSTCSNQLEKHGEPTKINRKRARPSESCRVRPRDRQLIEDRVKELRELVPNGSKGSIDSLLERTIKHMLFLKIVTKHAKKMKKCAESKSCNERMGFQGSCSHEHGSSWAIEVGNQINVCPIAVRNLNMKGQMLVEMLCEECSYFIEIAEAIRNLGLTILKGSMEARDEKTWACFVIEGQNDRGMHRVDILWSLLQLLRPMTLI